VSVRAMSRPQPLSDTTDSTDLNSVVAERPHLPPRGNIVGLDGEGCVHYHSVAENRVWVIDPDPATPVDSVLTHEQEVRDIWAWIAHTRDCRGEWAELRYHRGGAFGAIAERIAEVSDGAE
jgi:hypothetical protein